MSCRLNSSKNLSKSSSVLMRCDVSKNLLLFWLGWCTPVSMCRRIKPKDRLILKAVVCCVYRDSTISGKVDAVISWSVKVYRSWIRLPVASSIRLECQCCIYNALVSGSSGNTSGPTGFSMGVLGGGDTVRRCFVTGPGSGASGLFIGSLCLASGLSCWARWRARLSSLLKY